MTLRIPALVFLSLQAAARGQSNWDALKRLRPDQPVKIYKTDGGVLKGTWQVSSTAEYGIRNRQGNVIPLTPGNVERVTVKSRAKGALWGGLAAFAVAAPVGAYAAPYAADIGNPTGGTRLRHALGWGMFSCGIGAGIGALAGAEKTIFRR